jgi:protein involved in polysaccharide export with SLBB domain
MSLEMQRQMTRIAWATGVALAALLFGCAHHVPANTPPPAALLPITPPAPGAEYRIQLGDSLHVRFMYQPDMDEEVPVRPDGRISLAAVGEVTVVGLTPVELEKIIVERASSHLREPQVTVVVTKLGEQHVFIGGEVGKPGYLVLTPGMTPLQAVLASGGFRPTAKLESVLLITPKSDGHFEAARVNMKQVVDDGVPERVRLHPNDVVFVPRTWIADADLVVEQYVVGLVPAFPHVGAGYSINNGL